MAFCLFTSQATAAQDFSWQKLEAFMALSEKVGAHMGGSKEEKQIADWLETQFQSLGYEVKREAFEYSLRNKSYQSENLVVDIKGQSDKTYVVGAHYDSVGGRSGSLGIIDNGAGVIALLGLAEALKGQELPFSVRLIGFGAEEVGLQGSYAYANAADLSKVVGMINLDTIVGGDQLYIHSARTKGYDCKRVNEAKFSAPATLRDKLIGISEKLFADKAHKLHKATPEFPQGETGSWSDHTPFACSGIEIAYLEATNFDIHGKSGQDGYSQTADPEYWTCFNKETMATCDRKREMRWGEIWHTNFDTPEKLIPRLETRLKSQLAQNIAVLVAFFKQHTG